jgi:hypothetical protein
MAQKLSNTFSLFDIPAPDHPIPPCREQQLTIRTKERAVKRKIPMFNTISLNSGYT